MRSIQDLMYALIGFQYLYNGGRKCDVLDGPCNCGAWHHDNENDYALRVEWNWRQTAGPRTPDRKARLSELRELLHSWVAGSIYEPDLNSFYGEGKAQRHLKLVPKEEE